ncbi:MAG TPA: potassium/proton antiporter [Anaerolineaceae bacterium]|nr:potassium/proton antiporter [Anaerolineaceae bacterium]
MPENLEIIFIIGSVLVLLSVMVSKITERFGVPLLLLFLLLGMVAGSEGLGGIYFDDPVLTQWIATIALSVILFSGGVDTDWKRIKPLFKEGLLLATLGVLLTAAVVSVFSKFALHLSWQVSLLIGAIASSTDAAAVFALLRAKGINLKGTLAPLLELESGSNDPMAIFLTIGIIQWIQNSIDKPAELILLFFSQMGIGFVVGWLMSKVALFLINRLKLGYEGLYPVLTFALVFLTFGLADLMQGSGYLAVYVLGLMLSRDDFLHKRSLVRFFDGNAWLMQIALFITLGLLVFPSQLKPVIVPGLLISLTLIILARPLAVFLTLIPFRYGFREKLFISWVGLRGAVPIVLGTFPLVAGISDAGEIFNLVFFIVITSVLLQGTLLPQVARWLRVDNPAPSRSRAPIEVVTEQGLKADLREIQISPASPAVNKAIYELKLPLEYLIILVLRDGEYIQPNGSLELRPGDTLFSLSEEDVYRQAQEILNGFSAEA